MNGVAKAMPAVKQTGSADFRAISILQIPIGAGGFVTGIDASTDGSRYVCRTDVGNAYVRNKGDSAWLPLFSPTTMEQKDYDPLPALNDKADGQGVAGIRIAPSNRDIIYASFSGYIWRSNDGGRSIRRTSSPQLTMLSNAGLQRLYNRTIDVDPRNPDRLIVGTYGEGMWYSSNGGKQWRKAELPAAGKSLDDRLGIHLVLFDNRAGDRIYVFVTGQGLFRSDQGTGGRFVAVEGGPRHAAGLLHGPDQSIFVTEQTNEAVGSLWRLLPEGRWTSVSPPFEINSLALDPRRPSRIIASDANGLFMSSEDGGATWAPRDRVKWERTRGEVGWTRELNSLFPADMIFDPVVPGRLYIAQGAGVALASSPTFPLPVSDWSAGIEQLCTFDTLAVPGGKLFLSAWDKSFWRVDDRDSYTNSFGFPLKHGREHSADPVFFGSFIDFAGDDPNFLVGVVAPSDVTAPGFTMDGGNNWSAFAGTPPAGWGHGGCIAASTRRNFVLLPSNNGFGAYTLDGGATWSSIKLDGANPTSGFANAFYVKRQNLSADKTRPGTFALVYTVVRENFYDNPLGGLWLTRDGGRSWSHILKGVIAPESTDPRDAMRQSLEARQFWRCQLDYVPGRSGELVYTPHADANADRFYWSQDDGKTWAELHKSIRNVTAFGFGKAGQGQARPAVFFWGQVQGWRGLYASFDWFASKPRLVTSFPSQMLAHVESVAGDLDRFGRAYLGTACAGWVQVELTV